MQERYDPAIVEPQAQRDWDEQGTFEAHCNLGMVDVEPLASDDIARLKTLLHRHLQYKRTCCNHHIGNTNNRYAQP